MSSLDVPGVAARIDNDDDDHNDDDHNDDDGTDHNGAAYMRNGPGPFGLSDSTGGDDGKHDAVRSAGGAAAGGTPDASHGYVTVTNARAAAFSVALVFGMLVSALISGLALLWQYGAIAGWYACFAAVVLTVVYVVYVLPALCKAAVRAASHG